MNAYTPREALAVLPVNRVRYPEHYIDARTERRGVLRTLFGRLSAFFEHRRIAGELNGLSDRELADIGLDRGNLHRVFDPAFGQRGS